MPIEIIPKPKVKKFSWAFVLLVIVIVLLLGLGGSYYYLHTTSNKISEDIEEKKIALIETPEEKALEKELLSQKAKISAFSRLLSEHQKPLNIFSFLEEVSHPDVWFPEFNFTSKGGVVTVSGEAKSFIALGQQLLILKELEILKDVKLSEISLAEEGGVDFALQLTFDPQILK